MKLGFYLIAVGSLALLLGILMLSSRNPSGTGLSMSQMLFYEGAGLALLGFLRIGWVIGQDTRRGMK
jgi:hypothetical protein